MPGRTARAVRSVPTTLVLKRLAKDQEFRNGMPFVGASLWIDLLNTTPFDGARQHDFLATQADGSAWLAAAGLAGLQTPPQQPMLAQLRETLRHAVDPLRQGKPAPAAAIAAINRLLDDVALRLQLRPERDGCRLLERLDPGPAGPSGIIAEDFARFVCDFEPARLKRCANPACTMVFYDRGKNNMRRWCTMSICGNRDKVARYRSRQAEK